MWMEVWVPGTILIKQNVLSITFFRRIAGIKGQKFKENGKQSARFVGNY